MTPYGAEGIADLIETLQGNNDLLAPFLALLSSQRLVEVLNLRLDLSRAMMSVLSSRAYQNAWYREYVRLRLAGRDPRLDPAMLFRLITLRDLTGNNDSLRHAEVLLSEDLSTNLQLEKAMKVLHHVLRAPLELRMVDWKRYLFLARTNIHYFSYLLCYFVRVDREALIGRETSWAARWLLHNSFDLAVVLATMREVKAWSAHRFYLLSLVHHLGRHDRLEGLKDSLDLLVSECQKASYVDIICEYSSSFFRKVRDSPLRAGGKEDVHPLTRRLDVVLEDSPWGGQVWDELDGITSKLRLSSEVFSEGLACNLRASEPKVVADSRLGTAQANLYDRGLNWLDYDPEIIAPTTLAWVKETFSNRGEVFQFLLGLYHAGKLVVTHELLDLLMREPSLDSYYTLVMLYFNGLLDVKGNNYYWLQRAGTFRSFFRFLIDQDLEVDRQVLQGMRRQSTYVNVWPIIEGALL